jgi:hypothetical protein
MITRLTSPAFSICAEVHVPAPLNVYRHRADLIQEFGRRNATFWVSWKVPARGERRLRTRIASRAGRLARTVLRPEAFEARPGFEQGPVDREVLTRQQGFDFLLRQNRSEKLRGDIAFEQPVTVLGEGCRIPHRVLDAEPDKPAEQRIMVEPLDQWARSGEAAGSLPGAEPRLPPSAARSNLGRAAGELDCPGEARDPTSTVVQSRDCGRDTHYWAPPAVG